MSPSSTNRYFISVRNPAILGYMISEIQANGGVIGRNSRVWPPHIDCNIEDRFAEKIKSWNGIKKIEKHDSDKDVVL